MKPAKFVLDTRCLFSVTKLLAFFSVLSFWTASVAAPNPSDPVTREQLEMEKLRQEISNLEREYSFWTTFPSYAGILTAFTAVVGLSLTAWQHFKQRKADLHQRQIEERHRLDEHFNQVVMNLAS